MQKQILVNGFAINRSKIERDMIDNKECIILRDVKSIKQDTVMNGMLYKADIVANTYQQLNDVLAPYSHPKRPNGDLLASTDWMAINEFHVGAKNINARLQTDGWVVNDIVIDVAYAGNSDRGRDLLNRIERMEAGEDVTLATSTGLYYSANNEEGEENGRKYTRVVTAMSFEHNAMLDEDETAAGLGCGFTANNEVVEQVSLVDELATDKRKKSLVKKVVNFLTGNQELSFELIRDLLYAEIRTFGDNEYSWIDSVFDEHFIYEKNSKYYRQNYSLNDGKITLIEAAQEVEKQIEFIAINTESEMDEKQVAEMITNALETQEQKIMTANKEVTDAQASEIKSLKEQLAANSDKELSAKRQAIKAKFGLTDIAVNTLVGAGLDDLYAQTVGAAPVAVGVDFDVNSDKALFVDFNAQLDSMETK